MGKFAFGKDDFKTDNLVRKPKPAFEAPKAEPKEAPRKASAEVPKTNYIDRPAKEKPPVKPAPAKKPDALDFDPSDDTYETELKKAKKKAGFKTPMMAMHFSTANYDYIREEAAARGTSATMVVNKIIELYRSDPAHVHKPVVIEEW